MKPTDLMIRDWVHVPKLVDTVENDNGNMQIKQLRMADLDCYSFKELTYDEIEPIPLTPEILEKNGFILEYNGYNYYENLDNTETNYLCVSFRTNKQPRKIEFEFTNKIFGKIKTIQYVHEFQHLLKLCKINKEIIL